MGCSSSSSSSAPALDTLQVPQESGKKEDSPNDTRVQELIASGLMGIDQQPRLPGPGVQSSCFSCENCCFQSLKKWWPKSGRVNPIPKIIITTS